MPFHLDLFPFTLRSEHQTGKNRRLRFQVCIVLQLVCRMIQYGNRLKVLEFAQPRSRGAFVLPSSSSQSAVLLSWASLQGFAATQAIGRSGGRRPRQSGQQTKRESYPSRSGRSWFLLGSVAMRRNSEGPFVPHTPRLGGGDG